MSSWRARDATYLSICLFAVLTTVAHAAVTTYTSEAEFNAALPGPATTLTFDSFAAGTTVPSGGDLDGISFTYNLGDAQLQVTAAYPAASGTNALGTTDANILQDADNLSFGFSARNAVGVRVISKDPLQNSDISLAAGGGTASLVASAVQQTLSDGANVYFLGVISTTTAFTNASLVTVGGGYFFYNLDDITTATTQDSDGDGIANNVDNCTQVPNANQCDSDADGYGNGCDADLTEDGVTNAQDYVIFRSTLGGDSTAPTYNVGDMNCNGVVNAQDYVLFRHLLGSPPGPSGLHP